jgi:hypothetical protein
MYKNQILPLITFVMCLLFFKCSYLLTAEILFDDRIEIRLTLLKKYKQHRLMISQISSIDTKLNF